MKIRIRKPVHGDFEVMERACRRRPCFQPGIFEHRSPTLSGFVTTNHREMCCLWRANHGCPDPLPEPVRRG